MIVLNTWETQHRPANLMKDNQLIISILEIVLRLMNLILFPSTQLRSILLLHNQILTDTPSDFAYLLSGKAGLPHLPIRNLYVFLLYCTFTGKWKLKISNIKNYSKCLYFDLLSSHLNHVQTAAADHSEFNFLTYRTTAETCGLTTFKSNKIDPRKGNFCCVYPQ